MAYGTTLARLRKRSQKQTHRVTMDLGVDKLLPARGHHTLFFLPNTQSSPTETMPNGGGQLGTPAQVSCAL